MSTLSCFVLLSLSLAQSAPSPILTIAEEGEAQLQIVVAVDATLAEQTAAKELADYLEKVTGGKFQINAENGDSNAVSRICVGPTRVAERAGLTATELKPEEWVIRTVGKDLILVGGRPRGTLYAVYHFLEDIVGVHWWNPWEETVPAKPTLTVEPLDRRGKPAFRYRDIHMLYGNDDGRFAARNRLNRQGDAGISANYGGAMDYGPPYHVHTFNLYVPPKAFFKDHPEWFSLIDGKRSSDRTQLCLTNQELRAFFAAKLKRFVKQSRQKAAKAGASPPNVFSVSQNDWTRSCQCDQCQALVKAEGSEAGPLLDFVNFMADSIKDEYPGIYIDTLAYWYTETTPKTIKPRDNVIVRLCDTGSNYIKPITDSKNIAFKEHVLGWSKIAHNLRIWDYAVTYGSYSGFPMPTVHTYAADFRFYLEHNVEGVLTEYEYPILADMRDFKIWMMMKLLEDPYRNYDNLVRAFTDGFYGPAGGHVREYLSRLEAAAQAKQSHLSMAGNPRAAHYLDLEFVREATAIFDAAEQAAHNDSVLMRRLRHARLSLDRATVVVFSELVREWIRSGHSPETMPLNRGAIARRYKATWYEQIDFRLPPNQREAERKVADAEVADLTTFPAFVPLPTRFRQQPPGRVFDFTADIARNHKDVARVVSDRDAESGFADRLELRDEDPETNISRYQLPMGWGLYDRSNGKQQGSAAIRTQDVPGPGYHWYKMGTFEIGPGDYIFFFWSWNIQFDIDDAADPAEPGQPFEIWASIKFEGPGFPHAKPGDKNAISVERIVLVKAKPK